MNVEIMKFLDKWVGIPLCITLCSIGRLIDCFAKKRDEKTNVNKILVIRIWGMGDMVLALPALKALREKFPTAHITLLTTPYLKSIMEDDPHVDELMILDVSGVDSVIKSFLSALIGIRRKKFDLAVDFEQYSRASALFAYLSGARERVGFDTVKQWRGFLFTKRVAFNANQHVVECFLDLMDTIGATLSHKKLEKIWISDEERRFISAFLENYNISDSDVIIGIHIGSSDIITQWLSDRFAEVADRLIEMYDAKIIFTGDASEVEDIREVVELMKASPIIAAGKTSVKQLAALVERCDLFISNDTGPMHIAAAMGTPTIGLFGSSTPLRYGPYGKEHIAIYKALECSPCVIAHTGEGKGKKCGSRDCMKAISVDDVMEAVEREMERIGKVQR